MSCFPHITVLLAEDLGGHFLASWARIGHRLSDRIRSMVRETRIATRMLGTASAAILRPSLRCIGVLRFRYVAA